MTAYWVGDVPAVPVLLSPARDGRHVDLELFTEATAELLSPTGATWAATAQLVDDTDEGRVVSVLVPGQLTVAGIYWLALTLVTATGGSERYRLPVVVQAANGWHSLDSARAQWPDALELDDARLFTLLEVSRIECAAYGPALPAGELPPLNYLEAQLTHARNRNAAWRVDAVSGSEDGTYNIGVHPLDWVVKQLLRPERAVKSVR